MRTRDQLEQAFAALPAAPRGRGQVRVIVARTAPGEHQILDTGELDVDRGLIGDRWLTEEPLEPECQITIMELRVVELLRAPDQPIHLAGDNLLVDLDLSEESLPVGTRLRVGTALLEVSEMPHRGCKIFSARFGGEALAWVNGHDRWTARLRGINCRILEGGRVATGDPIAVEP